MPKDALTCKRGHLYTPENTIRQKPGWRACRACVNAKCRERRARERAGIEAPAVDWRDLYWAKVDRSNPDGCWPWTAQRLKDGYGKFKYLRKQILATHLALMLDGRERPPGLIALHSCDNPPCVNPAHLRWGTNRENYLDSVSRNRRAKAGAHILQEQEK